MKLAFAFACPICRSSLTRVDAVTLLCPLDGSVYPCLDGIWRFLPPELDRYYQKFMQEYATVRKAEGRGEASSPYYRSLPYQDLSGRFQADWKIRARSFDALLGSVLEPMEKMYHHPLVVLDLGAGNGWLSYRLAQRGHRVAAVDLQTNPLDGLGAYVHYDREFLPIQADFNHLPFLNGQMDVVIFNASFHYSTDYITSLEMALGMLHTGGSLVILDSPIYHDENSGAEMVREREALFQEHYGFASHAIPSQNYLTYRRLEELGRDCGVAWRYIGANYGLAWALRPWRARLAGQREPAQFQIVTGRRPA